MWKEVDLDVSGTQPDLVLGGVQERKIQQSSNPSSGHRPDGAMSQSQLAGWEAQLVAGLVGSIGTPGSSWGPLPACHQRYCRVEGFPPCAMLFKYMRALPLCGSVCNTSFLGSRQG